MIAWLFVFMLGFTVGALLSWLYTRYMECPAAMHRPPGPEMEQVDVALREQDGRLEVYVQGRWYTSARGLPEKVLHHMQRRSLQWLRWLKAGDQLYHREAARTGSPPVAVSTAREAPDTARMYAQIEARARRLLAAQGVQVLLRLIPKGPGVQIQVGEQHYNSVEEIPDERVREALREAARSWEADLKRKMTRPQGPNP